MFFVITFRNKAKEMIQASELINPTILHKFMGKFPLIRQPLGILQKANAFLFIMLFLHQQKVCITKGKLTSFN